MKWRDKRAEQNTEGASGDGEGGGSPMEGAASGGGQGGRAVGSGEGIEYLDLRPLILALLHRFPEALPGLIEAPLV